MPDKPTTPETAPVNSTKPFSFGLLHGASKGRLSTKRRTLSVARTDNDAAAQATSPDVPVAYRNPVAEIAAVPIENGAQPTLPADRINMDVNNFFSAVSGKKELLITASAAKSLTRLFAALTVEPGSGREVPAHIRTQVLDTLVRESHILADAICGIVMEEGRKPPVYLRAKLLQQAAEFLSEQWIRHGRLDTENLLEMTKLAFHGHVDSLTQDVVDLFHKAGEYTPATDQDISDARITEAVVRANWSLLRQVNYFDLNEYDPNPVKEEGDRPFSYGRDPHEVAKKLTTIALSITRENALDIDHMDLATTWAQNSIERATALVRSEYRMLTDRALRASFGDELLSEAAINNVNSMYDKIMSRIHERARNGFILVERNALDAMAANAYTHYVPRKQGQSESEQAQSAGQADQESVGDDTLAQTAPQRTSKFSFGR